MKHIANDSVLLEQIHKPGFAEWFGTHGESGEDWYHAWDITLAKRLVNTALACTPHEQLLNAGRISRAELDDDTIAAVQNSGTEIDPEYLRSDRCDPRRMLIAAHFDGRNWIIDGHHRVRKAIALKWEWFAVFLLSPQEDQACRVCPCCAPPNANLHLCHLVLEQLAQLNNSIKEMQ